MRTATELLDHRFVLERSMIRRKSHQVGVANLRASKQLRQAGLLSERLAENFRDQGFVDLARLDPRAIHERGFPLQRLAFS